MNNEKSEKVAPYFSKNIAFNKVTMVAQQIFEIEV